MLQGKNDVSCTNSRTVIDYIRRTRPERLPEVFSGLPDPCEDLKDPAAFLSDENNWIPCAVMVQIFRNVRQITGDPEIAFRIGFESIADKEWGYIRRLFLTAFATPRAVFKRLNQINTKFNTTKVVEPVYEAPGRMVVRWHWVAGKNSSKDICRFNQGIYAAIPTIWGMPAAEINERSCHFQGDPYCEVEFSWSLIKGRMRSILYRLLTRKSSLFGALEEIERDKALLRQKFGELDILNRRLKSRIVTLKSINNSTRALVSQSGTHKVLEMTMKPIVEVMAFDRAIIMLKDRSGEFLEYVYGIGESPEMMARMAHYSVPLNRDENLMIRVFKRKRPVIVRDVARAHLNPMNRILSDFAPSAFVICPLIAEDKPIGILGVDRKAQGRPITSEDAEYLSIFANNIATAFQRARLDEELKLSYVNSVRALVQAIEEKDTYTRGHSERVAALALEIARILGFGGEDLEFLRFGSILHDVGKIGISESIVRSPKRLSSAEFLIIQKHPLKGVEILAPISMLKRHLYLVRNHHERFDGSGYPDGLKGNDIPLGAQIVAIADAFDAMTSSRPYRKGMPAKQAAREIFRCSGSQFSPEMTDAFRKVFEEKILTGQLAIANN